MKTESGLEVWGRSRSGSGAGRGGQKAWLAKRLVLDGPISHEIKRERVGQIMISYIDIHGDVLWRETKHENERLVRVIIPQNMRPEDYNVDVEYSQLPLMAVKKFRDFIKVYLKKIQIQEDVLPVEIRGISKYFEVHLAGYSEAATMFEQVTQEMSKIRRDLGDPMNVAKLRLVLNALGVESACDRVLMFSEKEGPVCMGKSD